MDDLNGHARLLAVSRAAREFHVAQGLAAERTHVLYNGVDTQRFCPRSATGWLHRQLGIPESSMLVGTIGQLGPRKGQDVLLPRQSLIHCLPNVHYVLVGERHSSKGESRQYEMQLHAVAKGALSGRVHFLGFRNDVPRLLNELDLLVHPARQEPLGRVLLEAAAAGVAVIATDVGGTREIFPRPTPRRSLCQPATSMPWPRQFFAWPAMMRPAVCWVRPRGRRRATVQHPNGRGWLVAALPSRGTRIRRARNPRCALT